MVEDASAGSSAWAGGPGDAGADGAMAPVGTKDAEARQIEGDVLKPMEFWAPHVLQYTTVPAISSDGKLAFFVRRTNDQLSDMGLTATLIDIDSDQGVWEKIIIAPNECPSSQMACVQLVNDRQREVNAHLATLQWIMPELCVLKAVEITDESQSCRPVLVARRCGQPEFAIDYQEPRLRVVGADGVILVDRLFPSWAPPDVPWCRDKNRAYPQAMGFDRTRRMMFITLTYCEEGCGEPPQRLHVFRLPDFKSDSAMPAASAHSDQPPDAGRSSENQHSFPSGGLDGGDDAAASDLVQ
jgi:hypothetical protein